MLSLKVKLENDTHILNVAEVVKHIFREYVYSGKKWFVMSASTQSIIKSISTTPMQGV